MAKKMLVMLLLLLMVFEANPWSRRRRRRAVPTCDSSRPSWIDWDNDWNEDMFMECSDNYSIRRWHSVHRNCKEDRIHSIGCEESPTPYGYGDCTWSHRYQNEFDEPVDYECHQNGFITGVRSIYSKSHRDRRFKFRCCRKCDFVAHSCKLTSRQNGWDKELDYYVPDDYFLVGVQSKHDDTYEDRRYKFRVCKFMNVSGK